MHRTERTPDSIARRLVLMKPPPRGKIPPEAERNQVRNAFSRYLAPSLVEELAANPDRLRLGGEMREVTLMFADVRSFTSIAEKLDATDIRFVPMSALDGDNVVNRSEHMPWYRVDGAPGPAMLELLESVRGFAKRRQHALDLGLQRFVDGEMFLERDLALHVECS